MILIVDDEEDLGTLLQHLLRFAGHDAVAVKSGQEALAFIARERPSLLVLDLHMADMDGFAVLRALKQSAETQSLPVLVYSANSTDEARAEALRLGAVDMLLKNGFHFDQLVDRIRELAGPPRDQLVNV